MKRSARRAAACRSSRIKSMNCSGVASRERKSARIARNAKRRCTSSSADSNQLAPFDGATTAGSDRFERKPLAVVAQKPRPQPSPCERRFSGTRGSENDEKARRLARGEPAQGVDPADDVRVASEEDGGILRFERLKAALGRSPAEGAVLIRLQLEDVRAYAGGLIETEPEFPKAGAGDVDWRLILGHGVNRSNPPLRAALQKSVSLAALDFGGEAADC